MKEIIIKRIWPVLFTLLACLSIMPLSLNADNLNKQPLPKIKIYNPEEYKKNKSRNNKDTDDEVSRQRKIKGKAKRLLEQFLLIMWDFEDGESAPRQLKHLNSLFKNRYWGQYNPEKDLVEEFQKINPHFNFDSLKNSKINRLLDKKLIDPNDTIFLIDNFWMYAYLWELEWGVVYSDDYLAKKAKEEIFDVKRGYGIIQPQFGAENTRHNGNRVSYSKSDSAMAIGLSEALWRLNGSFLKSVQELPSKNYVYSPFASALELMMFANGIEPKYQKIISNYLGLYNAKINKINNFLKLIIDDI